MLVTKFTLGGKVEKKEGEKNHNKKKGGLGFFLGDCFGLAGCSPNTHRGRCK